MNDIARRAVLRGGALAGMASVSASAASLPVPGDGAAQPARPVVSVADRRALALSPNPAVGQLAYLEEPGREGLFRCVAAAVPAGDPLQGLSVPAGIAGLSWVREWDGTHGRPEWFGARVNDYRADCADAIEACYALCPVTMLSQADYFIRRTLRFQRSWRTVTGVGRWATDQDRGTRIILQGAAPDIHTADILVVGPARQPLSQSGLTCENHLSGFTLIRDGSCTPHSSGSPIRYPTGLRANFLLHCTFRDITSLESSVGFYIGGVVYTKFDDCLTQRVRPGTSASGDRMIGYYLDGRISFGFAGGNASVYIQRCLAVDQHASHVEPVGLLAEGAFVDSFLDHVETARIDNGMAFRVDGARNPGQTVDLHIRNAVLDGCGGYGIDIALDSTSSASVEIFDPYIYAAGSGGRAGIFIHDGAGLATITGGQIHGDFREGSLRLERTRGVRVQGLKIHQATHPVVVASASALHLEPQVTNAGINAPGFAVTCQGLSRSIVRPIVTGSGGPAFLGGISLDAASNYSQIDGTGIDPGCFAQVDARYKVVFNNVDARAGGPANAFAKAGNILTGVTG